MNLTLLVTTVAFKLHLTLKINTLLDYLVQTEGSVACTAENLIGSHTFIWIF